MKGVPLCHELANALRDMIAPTIAVPTRPQENIHDPDPAAAAGAEIANPDFEADFIMWQGELKGIPKKRAALKTLAQTAYTELMELCDPVLKTKIKALNNYPTLSTEMNPVELLIVIRGMANRVEQNDNQVMAVAGICKQAALMQQGPSESNENYYKAFKAMIEAQVVHGGNIALAPGLIATEAAAIAAENGRVDPNDEDSSAAMAVVEEKMNAAYFLLGADERRHKELLTYLKNQFTVGNDCYPPNMPAALELMETFVPSKPMQVQRPPIHDDEGDGLNFAQAGVEEEVDTGECHYQKKKGSYTKGSYAKAVKKSIEAPKKQEEDELCSHCGDPHPLAKCPKISLGQLEQIERQLMQKEEEEVGDNFFQTSEMGDNSGVMLLHDDGTAPNHSSKLFLDTCSTFPLATNPEFLTNIKPAKKALKYATNAGGKKLTKMGNLGSMNGVYLDNTALASVTPLTKLEEMFAEVKYSSRERGGAFVCTTSDGKEVLFKRDPKTSFPFIDLDEDGSELAVTMIQQEEKTEKVNTVRANYEGWTLKEVRDAIRARKAQAQAGHPGEATLKYEVSHKNENSLYRTCPVTSKAVTNARRIFGPSKECIKGKQVRKKPNRVEPNYVSIPARIVSENRDVHLVGDVMFVNGIPFLVTMSRRIRFVTVQHVPDRRAPMLANVMKHVINLYKRSGFNVQTSLMDGEFEKLTEKLSGYIEVNTTAKNEHVGEIERMIRTIKDRCRAMEAAMPFKVLPNIIIKHMVINAVMLRNAHIDKQGISQVYSPRELVLRWNLNFKLHCPLIFGSFCLAYDENDITNNMKERAIDGIYLGTAGNMQGSNKILSLNSGKVVKRRKVTELPMPESLIVKINKWGKRNKQAGRIRFADRDGNEFDWNDEQLVHDNAPEPEEAVAPFPTTPAEIPGMDLERNLPGDMLPVVEDDEPSMAERAEAALANAGLAPRQAIENPGVGMQNAGVGGAVNYVPAQEDEVIEYVEDDDDDDDSSYHTADAEEDEPSELDTDVDNSDDEEGDEEEEEAETVDENELADMDENVNVRRSTRTTSRPTDLNYDRFGGLANEIEVGEIHLTKEGRVHFHPDTVTGTITRPYTKKKDMSSLYYRESDYKKFKEEAEAEDKIDPIEIAEDEVDLFGMLMMQVSLKKGMELFGEERTKRGAYKEVKQLHDLNVFFPRDPKTLTRRERVMTLSSLIFMKEKHEGEDGVKGRACVNGAPQRAYIPKEEASSPTVNNDSIFITSSVGAHQRRDFATLDLPGAFCNTPLEDEVVIMALRGELCELMVRTDPKLYRKYVTTSKNGKPLLYVQLTKALYGLLRSALLFYRKLRKELETYGFEFNPYDPCVCNMMVKMTKVENGVEKDVLETDEEGRIVFDENGKPKMEMVQFTIVFHVDDLHMSCRNSFEITKFWSYINKLYNNKVNITRGKVHKFLGMRFDYSEEGIFRCDMIEYIKQIFADFPEEITKSSPSPHSDNLFKIRDEDKRELLDEKMASAFHHTVAQLLFLSHRARRDLSPAVPFLTSRVKSPDEDDWGKVRRVLQYLRGTLHMPIRLEVHSTDVPEWDIDASHGVHDDCKGQTGAGEQ